MTTHFSDLGSMGLFLATRVPMIAVELHEGLEAIGARVQHVAQAEFGTYQEAAGPFPGWPELADSTKNDRVSQGYAENEPLLRTGETRDSFGHEVDHGKLEVVIGSTSEKMIWHEFGTSKMPARPVLGPAAFHSKDVIQKLVGRSVMVGLIGKDRIHAALGYDMETVD